MAEQPDSDNTCAPVARRVNDHVELRNARLGDASPVLKATVDDWGDFLIDIQDGIMWGGSLRYKTASDGTVTLWHTEDLGPLMEFTSEEWAHLVDHIKRGDMDIERLPLALDAPA